MQGEAIELADLVLREWPEEVPAIFVRELLILNKFAKPRSGGGLLAGVCPPCAGIRGAVLLVGGGSEPSGGQYLWRESTFCGEPSNWVSRWLMPAWSWPEASQLTWASLQEAADVLRGTSGAVSAPPVADHFYLGPCLLERLGNWEEAGEALSGSGSAPGKAVIKDGLVRGGSPSGGGEGKRQRKYFAASPVGIQAAFHAGHQEARRRPRR